MAQICENTYDEDGNLVNGAGSSTTTSNDSCAKPPNAIPGVGASACPPTSADQTCKPFQLTDFRDTCFQEQVSGELTNIGGADINVFKLLGIHEQGKLIDLTENGSAISSGDAVGFPKEEAFTTFVTEWHSAQLGPAVLTSGFIGYDFGEIKLPNGRDRYCPETAIKHNIATIKIKQGNASANRATKVRVERSENGTRWFGSAILVLPDDNCLNTIHFQNTAPMRYWRLRPLEFNGGAADHWAVQAFEMYDYDLTTIEDIQDKIWNENRDRDYATQTIGIKGLYDLIDVDTDLSRFGIELPTQNLTFTVNFNATVAALGRPIVIGDIFEVPSQVQFDVNLNPIKKYMEVTDVGWDSASFTPQWQPTSQRIVTQPMMATQETADIVGGLEGYDDPNSGFFENIAGEGMDSGTNPNFQDIADIDQTIKQTASDQNNLPERGREIGDIVEFSEAQCDAAADQGVQDADGNPNLNKLGARSKALYVEDAMPPNHAPFTEGDVLPDIATAVDCSYHRLTYTNLAADIPTRLYRFSSVKNKWIFLERDKRGQAKDTKPILQEFLCSSDRTPPDKI